MHGVVPCVACPGIALEPASQEQEEAIASTRIKKGKESNIAMDWMPKVSKAVHVANKVVNRSKKVTAGGICLQTCRRLHHS